MHTTLKQRNILRLLACVFTICIWAACHGSRKHPEITCRLMSVQLARSDLEFGAFKARLRLQLTSSSRATCHPYRSMAFEVRANRAQSFLVIPRPQLRPPPPGGAQERSVIISKEPVIVEIGLSDGYMLSLRDQYQNETKIEFFARYSEGGHRSNYIFVEGILK